MSSTKLSNYYACGNECEIIEDQLYFVTLRKKPRSTTTVQYFCTDDEFVYNRFYEDFGPLNLAMLYRYCCKLNRKLKVCMASNRRLVHYVHDEAIKRSNAAFLIGCYSIIYLKRTPEEALAPLLANNNAPYLPFRDASFGPSTYSLLLIDCLRGLYKALLHGFFKVESFNLSEYEHYEKVENGDLNWIIPHKLLAFCGPQSQHRIDSGYMCFTPEMYLSYFQSHNVTDVVRLNNRVYNASRFTNSGLSHHDLYFTDGSVPTGEILRRFLHICETAAGAIAVHCKAGLGRTGTLIGCYLMKHYQMTAAETIAWIRIARPGSILGPQQHYLEEKQECLWNEAERLQELSNRAGIAENIGCLATVVNELHLDNNMNSEEDCANCLPLQQEDVDDAKDSLLETNVTQGDLLNRCKLQRIGSRRIRKGKIRFSENCFASNSVTCGVSCGRVTRSVAVQ